MKCEVCGRDNLTEKELRVHKLVYHKPATNREKSSHGVCPDCGASLIMQEGCVMCMCGYSKC